MAYNLYQVQMSNAWAQRINKENATAEKFWNEPRSENFSVGLQSALLGPSHSPPARGGDYYMPLSATVDVAYPPVAGSIAPSGKTSGTTKTAFLRSKLEKLESELSAERESRKKVEADLADLKTSMKRH
ncbi:hypothetical protein TSOC_009334 [Tetrabaena socialis]|uniref:Uncharacterized protein n=1 Tax=Tetrabaena socialis TaxID=47790 RepID=A0A2J7ZW78_9CHLO|nr:hypothetical protein TSOC_009334 [Tetrabaena socialis]|eukprot:PNH04506.1 hypothetical protein TSOC_009334 [Tetrabaena socialis]